MSECNAISDMRHYQTSDGKGIVITQKTKVKCIEPKGHPLPHKGWLQYFSEPGVKKQVKYVWN